MRILASIGISSPSLCSRTNNSHLLGSHSVLYFHLRWSKRSDSCFIITSLLSLKTVATEWSVFFFKIFVSVFFYNTENSDINHCLRLNIQELLTWEPRDIFIGATSFFFPMLKPDAMGFLTSSSLFSTFFIFFKSFFSFSVLFRLELWPKSNASVEYNPSNSEINKTANSLNKWV